MKGAITLLMLVGLVLSGGCGQKNECEDGVRVAGDLSSPGMAADSAADYGAKGALNKDADFTLAAMLTYTIQDEHLAEAEYLDVLQRHGDIMPFRNIVQSERRHIEALEPLFAQCGIEVPENRGAEHVIPTETVREALEACVEGEIQNIEMYRVFMERELPSDVAQVFSSLKQASEQHLETFRRHLERQ